MVHNCSILDIITDKINKTEITTFSYETKHYFSSEQLFDVEAEKEHMDNFINTIQEIQHIADYKQKQLESFHDKIKTVDQSVFRNKAELHSLVGFIRANTYINKDWARQMQKYGFWDIFARSIRLDFVCFPTYSWFCCLKEIFWIFICIFLLMLLQDYSHAFTD